MKVSSEEVLEVLIHYIFVVNIHICVCLCVYVSVFVHIDTDRPLSIKILIIQTYLTNVWTIPFFACRTRPWKAAAQNSCWFFSQFQTVCFLPFSSIWETTFSKTVQKTEINILSKNTFWLQTVSCVFTVWKPPSLPSITEKTTAKYRSSKVLRSSLTKKTKQKKILTCMRSKMPSSLSEESTQKTKYKVA